ncbi:MAG: imidazoleglycerol-phosphate dehydratase [Actinomycetia bacterium]|nr:imidazoleglycerol-phosphate dehydratase [Actinomycetes bacterium]
MNPVEVERTTKETTVVVRLGTPGAVELPVPIFAHFLTALLTTWGVAADIRGGGDVSVDPHHLVEDIGIVLGRAVRQAWPGYAGIGRYGWAIVPMDEARVEAALDLSGRPGAWLEGFPGGPVGGVEGEVFAEFYTGFARGAEATVHVAVRAGSNRHHQWEAAFKATGLALRAATAPRGQEALSTKGVIG